MVRVRDDALTILRPEHAVRVEESSAPWALLESFNLVKRQCFDLVQLQTFIFAVERKLGVVHVEDQRPVLEMLRQNAKFIGGQPRLGDENRVSVYVFG